MEFKDIFAKREITAYWVRNKRSSSLCYKCSNCRQSMYVKGIEYWEECPICKAKMKGIIEEK